MTTTAIILASIFSVILILWGLFLLVIIKLADRIVDTNKQLMIIVAGKEEKPEHALRALVATQKPPQKNLTGIATGGKREKKKPTNTDYALTVGETHGV